MDNEIKDNECTFRPNRVLTKDYSASDIKVPFTERNYISAKKKQNNKNQSFQDVDPYTGHPLFKPMIGRSPKTEPRQRGENVWCFLYSQSKINDRQKKLRRDASEEKKTDNSFVQGKSQEMIEKMKEKSIRIIFNALDCDGDGKLYSKDINTSSKSFLYTSLGLPKEIIKVYEPIFEELNGLDCYLSYEDFAEISERHFEALPVIQKSNLLTYKSKSASKNKTKEPKLFQVFY